MDQHAARAALIDIRMPENMRAVLSNHVKYIFALPPFERLAPAVASHPDMLVFFSGESILTHALYEAQAPDTFDTIRSLGYRVMTTDEPIADAYPSDVLFNCAAVGRHVIGNKKSASQQILTLCEGELDFLHTNQGYAKCAAVIVSDTAIITEDISIQKCAERAGLDVLKIQKGHVSLDGYGYGFIGGASGTLGDTVFFCGNLDAHPNGQRIADFCKSHGRSAVSLSSDALYDYGSIIFI